MKKIVSALLVISMLPLFALTGVAASHRATITDVTEILNSLEDDVVYQHQDYNKNGSVTITDVTALLNALDKGKVIYVENNELPLHLSTSTRYLATYAPAKCAISVKVGNRAWADQTVEVRNGSRKYPTTFNRSLQEYVTTETLPASDAQYSLYVNGILVCSFDGPTKKPSGDIDLPIIPLG